MKITGRVRVRFAPSPTGAPHVGNMHTALFDWLAARHYGGEFILRVEDTDQTRLVPGSLERMMEGLRWLGLQWDEGPEVGGPHAPYVQSERLSVYQETAEELIRRGAAYRCYCTPEELDAERQAQIARKEPPRYSRRCRYMTPDERASRETARLPSTVRIAVPDDGRAAFDDLIRGEIAFEYAVINDMVLLKSNGWPTYHLSAMVDDHLMEITHILRGEDWISSTPIHLLVFQAMDWPVPVIGHLPVVLGPDKKKLSKRHGATELLWFRDAGYLPEALVNFLALLGWAPEDGTEVMSRDELVRKFTLDRVGANPAVFDYDKLDWMNGFYIRQLSADEVADRVIPFLARAELIPPQPDEETRDYILEIIPLIHERLKRLGEAPELTDFFFSDTHDLAYDPTLVVPKGMDAAATRSLLERTMAELLRLHAFDHATLEGALRPLAVELGVKTGQLFGALRVAVTGKTVAPPLFETMAVLGKDRSLDRVRRAIELLA
jgi:glutamyl-tRNA synthetase